MKILFISDYTLKQRQGGAQVSNDIIIKNHGVFKENKSLKNKPILPLDNSINGTTNSFARGREIPFSPLQLFVLILQ